MTTLWNVNDVFSMTFYTYDRIRKEAWKKWDSAVSLYIRYIEQARLQWTDSTYSTDNFMMKAMWWSKEKFYDVKPILQNLWLIELKEKRDESWKIMSHYIQVNYIIKSEDTTVLKSQSLENPESGKSNTNTICTKYKCLNTKNKYLPENSDEHTIEYIYSNYYWKWKGIDEKKCNKLIEDKLKQWITLEEIKQCIVLYNCECRLKQDFQYVKKLENRLTEFQPYTEEQIEETLYTVVKEYSKKKKSDEKFASSKPAKTLWSDLKETFGEERVKSMFKQANSSSIQLTFK